MPESRGMLCGTNGYGDIQIIMATRKKADPKPSKGDSLAEMLGMDDSPEPVLEPYERRKLSPFDFINEISFGKNNVMLDEDNEKAYLPFLVNKGLSQSFDTCQYASLMNSRPHIPNKAQFLFLMHAIPKRKRYDKWVKQEEIDNLDMVMDYFGYSRDKAIAALKLLTDDQIEKIKRRTFKGGIQKDA